MSEFMADNSGSLDRDESQEDERLNQDEEEEAVEMTTTTTVTIAPTSSGASHGNNTNHSTGYYDADKCRAHIANQIKVSKIDRFAVQISKALEVEQGLQIRLGNILNMFLKRSAQVTHDFTFKCKLGLQRHRQDRILNQQRKSLSKHHHLSKTDSKHQMPAISSNLNRRQYSISNDLLYGPGAQLVHVLLSQTPKSLPSSTKLSQTHIKKKHFRGESHQNEDHIHHGTTLIKGINVGGLSEEDYLLSDLFEPKLFVEKLEEQIHLNVQKSNLITTQLNKIRQLFERLALEHRDNVDTVYAAEEERQAASVTRRSAYNLSVAAIKATSTPVHVNPNTNETLS